MYILNTQPIVEWRAGMEIYYFLGARARLLGGSP